MKIVIEIPEGTKRAIDMGTINQVLTSKVWAAIKNGTPLSEHHGELLILDKNLIKQYLVPFDCSNNFWLNEVGIALSTIKTIPGNERG